MTDQPSNLSITRGKARPALERLRTTWNNRKISFDNPDRGVIMPVLEKLAKQEEITPESLGDALQEVLGGIRYRAPETKYGAYPDHRGYGQVPVEGTGHKQAWQYFDIFHEALFNKKSFWKTRREFTFMQAVKAPAARTDFFSKAKPAQAQEPKAAEKPRGPRVDRAALIEHLCDAITAYAKETSASDPRRPVDGLLPYWLEDLRARKTLQGSFNKHELQAFINKARYRSGLTPHELEACFDTAWAQLSSEPPPKSAIVEKIAAVEQVAAQPQQVAMVAAPAERTFRAGAFYSNASNLNARITARAFYAAFLPAIERMFAPAEGDTPEARAYRASQVLLGNFETTPEHPVQLHIVTMMDIGLGLSSYEKEFAGLPTAEAAYKEIHAFRDKIRECHRAAIEAAIKDGREQAPQPQLSQTKPQSMWAESVGEKPAIEARAPVAATALRDAFIAELTRALPETQWEGYPAKAAAARQKLQELLEKDDPQKFSKARLRLWKPSFTDGFHQGGSVEEAEQVRKFMATLDICYDNAALSAGLGGAQARG